MPVGTVALSCSALRASAVTSAALMPLPACLERMVETRIASVTRMARRGRAVSDDGHLAIGSGPGRAS